jgi:hypothetical protein
MSTRKTAAGAKGSPSVEMFLDTLEHPHAAALLRLRELILGLDPRITEAVKWNAPSFKIDGHFATFKLHPPKDIQLVLHTGAKVKIPPKEFQIDDPAALLKWPAKDRCVLTLQSAEALEEHESAVAGIVRQWIAQL